MHTILYAIWSVLGHLLIRALAGENAVPRGEPAQSNAEFSGGCFCSHQYESPSLAVKSVNEYGTVDSMGITPAVVLLCCYARYPGEAACAGR